MNKTTNNIIPDDPHNHVHGNHYEPPKPCAYFVPNELAFFVEHKRGFFPSGSTTDTFIQALGDYQLLPPNVMEEIERHHPVITFGNNTSEFDYSTFRVKASNLDVVEEFKRYAHLLNPDGISLTNLTIKTVMPNFFAGSAVHTAVGPHGPGGPPRAVVDTHLLEHLRFEIDIPAEEQDKIQETCKNDPDNRNVVVYILDTIPPMGRIQSAINKWPLLGRFESILAESRLSSEPYRYYTEKATYIYAGEMNQILPDEPPLPEGHKYYGVGNHDYDSSDHGLFIAGIVNSIAPEVPIYVIQVMNNRGVGTFTNFAAGYHKMVEIHRQHHADAHAIVNCSFSLSIPVDGHTNPDASPASADLATFLKTHAGFEAQLNEVSDGLRVSLAEGALVVASAGNDSDRKNQAPLPARYPAKWPHVQGVGALKQDNANFADYSNIADNPEPNGIYAFGGDYDNQHSKVPKDKNDKKYKKNDGEGIIGIFTGNLNIEIIDGSAKATDDAPSVSGFDPDWYFNPTGYAEWKGTSFAAPVVTGTIALLCSQTGLAPECLLKYIKATPDVSEHADKQPESKGKRLEKVKQKHDHPKP